MRTNPSAEGSVELPDWENMSPVYDQWRWRQMRSLTMTAEEAHKIRTDALDSDHCGLREAALSVAREAERRLLAKLRAVPLKRLVDAMRLDCDCPPCCEENAADIRHALLAAVEEGGG